jgi:hypothetical protein
LSPETAGVEVRCGRDTQSRLAILHPGRIRSMSAHDIDPTPTVLTSDPPVHVWPCRTCGLLVIDTEIHQRWAAQDLSDMPKSELHEEIAAQRGVSTGTAE